MVQISRKKLNSLFLNKLEGLFYQLFSNKKKEEFNIVILSTFSLIERIMIIKRIALIYLLLKKIEKYKIIETLNVTRATLDKYNLIIEKNPNIYHRYLNIIKKDKIILLLEEIFNFLFAPGVPGINWTEAWKRKNKIREKKEYGI